MLVQYADDIEVVVTFEMEGQVQAMINDHEASPCREQPAMSVLIR